MGKKIQEAILLYKDGKYAQASKLLSEIVLLDPNNFVAWYGLAKCSSEPDVKINCLQRVMSLDPTNQKAQQLLDKLLAEKNLSNHHLIPEIYNFPANKKPSSINWSIIIIIGIVGIIIAAVFALTRKEPYKPNASDAFSYAAGYALKEMYARDPVNYWCTETATKKASYWYQIAVTDLGNGRFYAIGATKAMDQNCVYQTGYFAATVYYEPEDWKLDGKIYHSNSCLTIANDSGECTAWDYGWTPDMNWRPPKK